MMPRVTADFNPAARLDVDDLRLDGLPLTGAVLVIHADVVDVAEHDGRLSAGEANASVVDHRRDHPVRYPRLLQRDQRIRVGCVLPRLGADGLNDQDVAETRVRHPDDRVVGHLRHGPGGGQRTSHIAIDCVLRRQQKRRRKA